MFFQSPFGAQRRILKASHRHRQGDLTAFGSKKLRPKWQRGANRPAWRTTNGPCIVVIKMQLSTLVKLSGTLSTMSLFLADPHLRPTRQRVAALAGLLSSLHF